MQVNDWMEGVIEDSYEDLYRFKGVLAIEDWPDRFIFQVRQQWECIQAACAYIAHTQRIHMLHQPYAEQAWYFTSPINYIDALIGLDLLNTVAYGA